jgi:hypothetical protein
MILRSHRLSVCIIGFVLFGLSTIPVQAEFMFQIGGGVAELDVGTPNRAFIANTPTSETVGYAKIEATWIAAGGFGVSVDYAEFDGFSHKYLHDYSRGIPFWVPNNTLEVEPRTAQVGILYEWKVFRRNGREVLTVRPVAGVIVSWVDSNWEKGLGGQDEGLGIPTMLTDSGAIGVQLGLGMHYRIGEHWTTGLAARALYTNAEIINAEKLEILGADFSVWYRF